MELRYGREAVVGTLVIIAVAIFVAGGFLVRAPVEVDWAAPLVPPPGGVLERAGEGFERNDGWGISFFPGETGEIEEIADLPRWLRREKGGRSSGRLKKSPSVHLRSPLQCTNEPTQTE